MKYSTIVDYDKDMYDDIVQMYAAEVSIEIHDEYMTMIFNSYECMKSFYIGQKYYDFDSDIEAGLIEEIK